MIVMVDNNYFIYNDNIALAIDDNNNDKNI